MTCIQTMTVEKISIKPKVASKDANTYLRGCFRIMGILMPDKYRAAYLCYAIVINCLSTVFAPLSFTASYFVKSNKNLSYDVVFTSLQAVLNVYGCTGKVFMLIYYLPKLKAAEQVMDRLDERCREDDEVAELYKIRTLGRRVVVFFGVAFWCYTTSTYISSLIAGVPSYSIYLFSIDWRRSRTEFYLASLFEYLMTSWTCFQQVGNDSYSTVHVCILRTHVKILLLRIRKMGTKPENSAADNLEELKMCIKDHKNIIELYNIISPVIARTVFLQFSLTAGILGLTLVNVALFSTTFASIAASVFYMLGVCVEIFPLCYYANCLLSDSDTLATELFHSSWIHQDVRYRKMLIFFMQRTQKTMEFWAGKIFPINLNTFISIAKFSFSLYTFIKTMDIKERLGL